MANTLSILLVEPDRDLAFQIVDALQTIENAEVHIIGDSAGLARKIEERDPDIVLIDVTNPSRDVLEDLALASGSMNRPVAMFVGSEGEGLERTAVEAGVSAYVVNGLTPERTRSVLDAAIARFQLFQRMRTELGEARRALEERKIIDRAKGLIMKARGLQEDEAYALLRKTAMDQGRKVVDVAQAIVTAAGLLS